MLFLNLEKEKIRLLDLIEEYPVDGENLDPQDEENQFWISWYRRAKISQTVEFDKWHIYDPKGQKGR